MVADFEGYVHWLAREEGSLLARTRVKNLEENFPMATALAESTYLEDRAVLAMPQVQDDYVYIMDKRGALNAIQVLSD